MMHACMMQFKDKNVGYMVKDNCIQYVPHQL